MPSDLELSSLLRAALDRDPARPLLTFYDDSTGERVELSVATFENWVAKTANLLVDGLGVEPGARVALRLPLHWQTSVWVGACWAVGVVPVVGEGVEADPEADVVVSGPELPDPLPRTADVVGLALRPMGARFAEPLPPGVVDYAAEVLGHGDRFVPPPAEPGAPALVLDGHEHSPEQVVAAARELADSWGLATGGRLLTRLGPTSLPGFLALLAVPLVVDGSAVVVRHAAGSEDDAAARRASERVTAEARD